MTLRATVLGTKFSRNGYGGDVRIVQQRVRDGKLVLVCKCGGCGRRYSLTTLEEAAPVIKAVRLEAERAARRDDMKGREFYEKIADRIETGYSRTAS